MTQGLSRRSFLQRFGIGLGAALTLAALPASAVQALSTVDAGRLCACEYLRKRYNDYMRGKSVGQLPQRMEVPKGLFDAYDGELTMAQRWCSPDDTPFNSSPHLLFKGTRLMVGEGFAPGWDVRFIERAA